jgi:hypothetical protein
MGLKKHRFLRLSVLFIVAATAFFSAVAQSGAPASITIVTDARPQTGQVFNFTATGPGVSNFSLFDDGVTAGANTQVFSGLTVFGPANTIRITENQPGGFFFLTNICCVEGGTGISNNLINVQSRFVDIALEPGENIVCTFVNAVPTAASVSVSGRTLNASGGPLSRVKVTIQNTITNETQTVNTNSLGRYQFDGLRVGDFYIITVTSKRYAFEPDTYSFVLNDVVENLDFTAASRQF